MRNRKNFIAKILKEVDSFLSEKNRRSSVYRPQKGYLADADILSHKFISDAIKEFYPNDIIFSEEDKEHSASKINEGSYLWMIDPICGTSNYVKGFPFYVHAISVFDSKGVLFSGIYHPGCNELFLADRKKTELNNKLVTVSKVAKLEEALISLNCNQSNSLKNEPNLIDLIQTFSPPRIRRVHILESANLEMAYVACGRLDAYVNPDDKIWDIAAGSLMINSAGGKTKVLNGTLESFSDKNIGIIASNKHLISEIKKMLVF